MPPADASKGRIADLIFTPREPFEPGPMPLERSQAEHDLHFRSTNGDGMASEAVEIVFETPENSVARSRLSGSDFVFPESPTPSVGGCHEPDPFPRRMGQRSGSIQLGHVPTVVPSRCSRAPRNRLV